MSFCCLVANGRREQTGGRGPPQGPLRGSWGPSYASCRGGRPPPWPSGFVRSSKPLGAPRPFFQKDVGPNSFVQILFSLFCMRQERGPQARRPLKAPHHPHQRRQKNPPKIHSTRTPQGSGGGPQPSGSTGGPSCGAPSRTARGAPPVRGGPLPPRSSQRSFFPQPQKGPSLHPENSVAALRLGSLLLLLLLQRVHGGPDGAWASGPQKGKVFPQWRHSQGPPLLRGDSRGARGPSPLDAAAAARIGPT